MKAALKMSRRRDRRRTRKKKKKEYFMTIRCFNRMMKVTEFVY